MTCKHLNLEEVCFQDYLNGSDNFQPQASSSNTSAAAGRQNKVNHTSFQLSGLLHFFMANRGPYIINKRMPVQPMHLFA